MGKIKKAYHKIENVISGNKIKEVRNLDFIMLDTPRHGNLGDQAIAYSEKLFFDKYLPDLKYGEIIGPKLWKYMDEYKKYVSKDTVLGISGGGHLGNVWFNEEVLCRIIMETFPDNKIIIFPQTVFFYDDDNSRKEIEKSREIYRDHTAPIKAFWRDDFSFEFAQTKYDTIDDNFEMPDMVFSLKPEIELVRKDRGLLVFRNDFEKAENRIAPERICEELKKRNLSYEVTDTNIDKKVYEKDREKEVMNILTNFASSKFVITDRLHGMIMSAITGTPCLAFDNISCKVSAGHKWIENLDYIKVIPHDADIAKELDWLLSVTEKKWKYDNSHLEKYYIKLAEEIKACTTYN